MSEYQYYEFLAIDHSLTPRQLAEVRAVSTRAELTPTSFVNEYHFGDFKGDPVTFLSKYYDVMVYYANWGTHRFMVSLPASAIEPRRLETYCLDYCVTVHAVGNKVVVELTSQVEDWDWEDNSNNWMAELAPVREMLIGGDLRPLYLAWLSGLPEADVDEAALELAVPPGLGQLPAALERLAEFLRVDPDLLDVAAQTSAPLPEKDETGFSQWVANLPEAEKTRLLVELATGIDPHAGAALQRRFIREQAAGQPAAPPPTARPVGQLLREADTAREQRERQLAAEKRAAAEARKARERAQYLDSLVGQEESLWKKVEGLVAEKKAEFYDQAMVLLCDLRDLSERSGQRPSFDQRVNGLRQHHERKTSFVERLRKAGM